MSILLILKISLYLILITSQKNLKVPQINCLGSRLVISLTFMKGNPHLIDYEMKKETYLLKNQGDPHLVETCYNVINMISPRLLNCWKNLSYQLILSMDNLRHCEYSRILRDINHGYTTLK
jgi:hypothetical protein